MKIMSLSSTFSENKYNDTFHKSKFISGLLGWFVAVSCYLPVIVFSEVFGCNRMNEGGDC
jgi:hypothetical protein